MEKKKKPLFKRWWFIAIVLIIVIGALGSRGKDEDNTGKDIEPSKAVVKQDDVKKELESEITVTAKEVIDLFEENEIKGKQTYTGKLAEITGVVNSVGEVLSSTYVTLGSGADFELITLQCYFKEADEIDKVAELKKGDTITIIGTIGEQSLNISVNKCKFK